MELTNLYYCMHYNSEHNQVLDQPVTVDSHVIMAMIILNALCVL